MHGEVATVDAVAMHDAETGRTAVFLVNRSQDESAEVSIDLRALGALAVLEFQTLADADVHAANTLLWQSNSAARCP